MNQLSTHIQDALQNAVIEGDLPLIKFLIEENRMNVNKKYSDGYLIHLALWSSDLKVIKYLVKMGADINKKNEGDTVLRAARVFLYYDYTPGMKKIIRYLSSITIQKQVKAKLARTKARAKLHTKIQQQTRTRLGADVSSIIASFLVGEPKSKYTFVAHKKRIMKR